MNQNVVINLNASVIYDRLKTLMGGVREKLVSVGLLGERENIPGIVVLQHVLEQPEPQRTQFLYELSHQAFAIAASEPFRVSWNRRTAWILPVAQTVPFLVANQAVQQALHNRFEPVSTVQRRQQPRQNPILLSWYGFYLDGSTPEDLKLADKNTPLDKIVAGPTYRALLSLHRQRQEYVDRQFRKDIGDLFMPDAHVGSTPREAFLQSPYAATLPANTPFQAIAQNVVPTQRPQLPQGVVSAMFQPPAPNGNGGHLPPQGTVLPPVRVPPQAVEAVASA